MKTKSHSNRGFITLRLLLGLSLCTASVAFAIFAVERSEAPVEQADSPQRDMPTLRDNPREETADLGRLEEARRHSAEAVAVMQATDERWCEPDIRRRANEIEAL